MITKAFHSYTKEDFKDIDIHKMTIEQIAEYMNCSVAKARIVINWLGWSNTFLRIKKYKTKQELQSEDKSIIELKYQTMNIKDLAKEYKCNIQIMSSYIKENNIKRKKYCKRLATIYDHMFERCYKPLDKSYKYYGKRGICICDEWLQNRRNFYQWATNNGYKDNLTLERIDVNGNYCPENCKWITMQDKQSNKTNNVFITYKGLKLTVTQWERKLNMPIGTLTGRIKRYGWTVERALTTPIVPRKKRK